MRVPLHIVEARRRKLAALLGKHRYLPIGELCRFLGVSEATARRDLNALAKSNVVTRTRGGALSEYNERFPSFRERRMGGTEAKHLIARAALRLMQPHGTYFFDSGTTIHALAEAFLENPVSPVKIITSNLPVGELLSDIPDVQIFLLAGQLLGRQSVLLGETACKSLAFWQFDIAFLSAEAANREGLWNSQSMIVEQQLAASARATHTVFCVDSRKIGLSAPFLLKPWNPADFFLTDAPKKILSKAGIPCDKSRLIPTNPGAKLPDLTPPTLGDQSLPVHFL